VTIKEAAERLNIKYSAAKSIVKIYRETGRAAKLSKKRPIINVI
jgi:transposase